jgi:hypothetical protein
MMNRQDVAGWELKTDPLSKHQRKQPGDQWIECDRTGINLQPVKASEKEKGDQWTECHRTGINNLQTVKALEKEKG